MVRKLVLWSGILGVLFFAATTVIGGYFYPNYSHVQRFISELYAVDAPNANLLRYFGYVPSGVLFLLFSITAIKSIPKSTLLTIGFIGIGFGYGFGTIICSLFNCDAGCNPKLINPTVSQIIHNAMGLLTYAIVPFAIMCIAIASRQWKNSHTFSQISFVVFLISFSFVVLLNMSLDSAYKGLIQRIIEGTILFWIVYTSIYVSKNTLTNATF
jgi:hypothetical protein